MSHSHWSLRAPAAACALASFLTLLESSRLSAEERTPQSLVKAALETELNGPSQLRGQLLAEALQLDPDYAPARWHSGYVRWDNQWVKIDDVPRLARSNERLTQYRKKRDAMVDTADQHRELARWCHKNGLPDEERVHWAKVLEFEQGDAETIAALGLQLHNGRLLTKPQIAQEKDRAAEAQRAMRHWQPKLVKWRRAIEGPRSPQRTEALRELKELNDPAAIPALEAVLATNATSAKAVELNRILIETVGRMPVPEATQVLLRRSIVPDSLEVRTAAADELKKRPMHAYVPMLIAALPGKCKSRFNVFVMPSGMVVREHEIYLEGRGADFSITLDSTFNPADTVGALITPIALAQELSSGAAVESEVQSLRANTESLRDRLQIVLKRTTGFENVDDPELWQKQYDDYYGWHSPAKIKPYYTQSYTSTGYSAAAPTNTAFTTVLTNRRPSGSCFPAGTLVETLQGPMSIESIRVGDQVLSKDPSTGELVYKPVQATTLRPSTPFIKIASGSHSLLATPGHPFWVDGQGWKMTKHLAAGEPLHALFGPVAVASLEDARAMEAYNLVISELHNYFVGEQRLLVHDNSPLLPTLSLVPGLSVTAERSQD